MLLCVSWTVRRTYPPSFLPGTSLHITHALYQTYRQLVSSSKQSWSGQPTAGAGKKKKGRKKTVHGTDNLLRLAASWCSS